jgi:GTP-binding protein
MLPVVSIIGRPNVGKSSLFNRIARKKIAVVDDMPGVTRDRNYAEASWASTDFTVVDTGGFMPSARDSLTKSVNEQIGMAIDESAAIIFCVDATTGPADIDMLIAKRLRRECIDRVILAVNKTESPSAAMETGEHMALGCGTPLPVSAIHGTGVADLLDRVIEIINANKGKAGRVDRPADISIAVLGRPNAGKSLLVNKLLSKNRMIVNDQPGTTRDSIDSFFVYEGRTIRIIDTAGLRRKGQVKDRLEYFTNVRSIDAIERCDVAALMIDISDGIASQDLKILALLQKAHKGVIVCLNKWDLVEKDHRTFDHMTAEIREQFSELRYIPIISISALSGQRLPSVINTAFEVKSRMTEKVNTADFKTAMFEWVQTTPHPPMPSGDIRFLGGKQIEGAFPQFLFFCTNHKNVQTGYERFLINKIYETFGFHGCPVGVIFKPPGKPSRRSQV